MHTPQSCDARKTSESCSSVQGIAQAPFGADVCSRFRPDGQDSEVMHTNRRAAGDATSPTITTKNYNDRDGIHVAPGHSLSPLPLALPLPAWHTAIEPAHCITDWEARGRFQKQFIRLLLAMSDAELLRLWESHEKARDFLRKVADTNDDWASCLNAHEVNDFIEAEQACRFRMALRKKRAISAARKEARKARVA